ncbi:MAG: hypothetical protein ACOCVV_11125, partial [Marinobacter sp.]
MKVKEYPPSLWRMAVLKARTPRQDGRKRATNVIVSLTSIASRLKLVHFAVRSVMNQSVTPDKIILWLGEDAKEAIPASLEQLVGQGFEIRFREDVGPHTKLVYCLKEFPDHTIVTC